MARWLSGWRRVSTAILPILAVLTALILTIPFMIFTGGRGDIQRGLNIAGTAYSALLEGALGVVINDIVAPEKLDLARSLAEQEALTPRNLRAWAADVDNVNRAGLENIIRYSQVLIRYPDLDDDEITELGIRISQIVAVGEARLEVMRPLIEALFPLERAQVRELSTRFNTLLEISESDRAELEALAPVVKDIEDEDLLVYMRVLHQEGIVKLERLVEQSDLLKSLNLAPNSPDADDFEAMAALELPKVRQMIETANRLGTLGITNAPALTYQLRVTNDLYSAGLLTNSNVAEAIAQDLLTVSASNLVVLRPGQNRLLVDAGKSDTIGIVWNKNNTPDDPSDDRPDTVYLRLGGKALVFFPGNLETMIVRAIPFVIAGLAVALGFKAGLFNIGATGQLYIGATLAAWVGFAFTGLPAVIHLPLVLLMGIIGGALWGAIPGALKAYTGAHEVINTIMLNFIAIRLVEWLIKAKNPYLLRDPAASSDQTPFLLQSGRLPSFDEISPIWFLLAGAAVLAWGLWSRRERLQQNPRAIVRVVIYAALTTLGGFFLSWLAVRSNLHIGLILMVCAVWFTGWFLDRTTLGFELRTVGANPDAARYAGMNVKWNMILAMALSGALAGLSGTIEVAGVQFNMKPEFFSDLGFDAIAVALLARTNPRNMISAGFLWGALLAGAGLMQIRASISIDLVKIIQALIIMFIAADTIIRYLWRVPQAKPEESIGSTFSKGWGS